MAAELDDLLLETKTPLPKRLLLFLLVVVALAGVILFAWRMWLAPQEETQAQEQTADVRKGAVTNSLSLSGTVAAESTSSLNFETSGIVTRVHVKLGQEVKAGDVLAEIDSVTAKDAVKQAELNLRGAQIKLNDMLSGPTAADKAAADQTLQQAQQTLTTATEDVRKLENGPTAADVASAQQAVSAAQSSLAQSQVSRDKLTSPSNNDRSSQESALRQAQNGISTAESTLRQADNSLSTAQGALYAAETAYCPDTNVSFCSVRAAPLNSVDESAMLSATASSADKATKAGAVLQANSAYKNALNSKSSAQTGLSAAQREYAAAQQKYYQTPSGPSASELASADAAIVAARQQLQAAQQKLRDLYQPDASKVLTAKATLEAARAGMTAAQTHRDEVYAGSKKSDIDPQRNTVALSQLALDKANAELEKTRLLAPFEGTVAALTIAPGDQALGTANGSSGSNTTAAITLNTPKALRLDLVVGESDYPKLKPGQKGFVSLSGLDSASFPIEVESIGTLPTTNQGVVTYQAKAKLLTDLTAMSGPGLVLPPTGEGQPQGIQRGTTPGGPVVTTPGGGSQQGVPPTGAPSQAGILPAATTGERPKPAPGMQGQATVITESKTDVIVVPVRAVTQQGLDSVVKVKKDDGSVETVKVKLGTRNAQVVEVTEGLKEGQKVVLPALPTSSGNTGGGDLKGAGPGNVTFVGPAGGASGGAGPGPVITFGP